MEREIETESAQMVEVTCGEVTYGEVTNDEVTNDA
jgi:hypothetical protein